MKAFKLAEEAERGTLQVCPFLMLHGLKITVIFPNWSELQSETKNFKRTYSEKNLPNHETVFLTIFLQVKALESLSNVQKSYGEEKASEETMKRVDELKEKYDISDTEEDVDSQEMESDCINDADEEEDVDFELLLESGNKNPKV